MDHRISQGGSALTKRLQEEVRGSRHKAKGFQEADRRTWHCPKTPQVFAQECTVGFSTLVVSIVAHFL